MADMISVSVQTLVVGSAPSPSILVLVPTEDFNSHRNCRVVPIWMGTFEAQQLGMAIEGKKMARPMTHDLFMDAITNLDARVDHVSIVDVHGQTFFSQLVLHAGERTITLDARPSDAVALALRQNAPIYMAEHVLRAASFPFVFRGERNDEAELEEFHAFVQSLSPEDFAEEK